MYFKINKTRDNFLTSEKPKKDYIKVDLKNTDEVAEKLDIAFWKSGKFDRNASFNYIKKQAQWRLESLAQESRLKILDISKERLATLATKAIAAKASLNNPSLLPIFQDEADGYGITTEQVRDIVIAKSDAAFLASNKIEVAFNKARKAIDMSKNKAEIEAILSAFQASEKS